MPHPLESAQDDPFRQSALVAPPAAARPVSQHEGRDWFWTSSLPDQELDTRKSIQVIYWEGSVNVTGTYEGNPVTGHGYVELTGYAGKFNQRI